MVEEAGSVSGAARKGLLKVIFTNPPVLISLLVIIAGFIIYIGMSAQHQASQITNQYSSLDAKPENSKEGFDKKLFYITVDENGNTVVHIGFESEEQELAAQQAAEEAGTTGNVSAGNTNPSNEGVFEKLADTSGSYNLSGQPTSVTANNGTEFPLYNGVPESWGWTNSTNVVIWHYTNTADAWIQNYGSETELSSCTTYQHFNKEFNRSTLSTYNGVQCLQICNFAAIVNCGFIPSGQSVDCYGSAKNKPAIIVIRDKTTNEYYYMPAYTTDAKAHTYPGGIVQTGCARYSSFSQCYDSNDDSCSDFGKPHAALHGSNGHYDYVDRPATVEIEANWTTQPMKSNWEIVDVLIQMG